SLLRLTTLLYLSISTNIKTTPPDSKKKATDPKRSLCFIINLKSKALAPSFPPPLSLDEIKPPPPAPPPPPPPPALA
ncbi:MAG: hypothetical protein E7I93_13870, partial [Clostridium perfringens]|nr:hypothetical protein [Clostridium perfringens]